MMSSDEYPEAYFFFGYPPEMAEEYMAAQCNFIECLCHLGMIWREQWDEDPESIPLEAEIHGK